MLRLPLLAGNEPQERLPGMLEWTSRKDVERIGKLLRAGRDPAEIGQREASRGALKDTLLGGAVGTGAGILSGRILSGQAAYDPFLAVKEKGLNAETIKGLSKLPTAMKALPAAGLALGAGTGLSRWFQGREQRRRRALEISKGLLTEDVLRQESLRPILSGIPQDSAVHATPVAVMAGNTGV